LKQFEGLIDKIGIDEIGIKEKIVVADIDIRNYAKYVLQEGKDVEKRELLGCLKGGIRLENKKIYLH